MIVIIKILITCQSYIMVTDRNYGKKKTFNLDRRRLRPIFSIIGFFPHKGFKNIPEVIRTFFFSIILGGGHYFHN